MVFLMVLSGHPLQPSSRVCHTMASMKEIRVWFNIWRHFLWSWRWPTYDAYITTHGVEGNHWWDSLLGHVLHRYTLKTGGVGRQGLVFVVGAMLLGRYWWGHLVQELERWTVVVVHVDVIRRRQEWRRPKNLFGCQEDWGGLYPGRVQWGATAGPGPQHFRTAKYDIKVGSISLAESSLQQSWF